MKHFLQFMFLLAGSFILMPVFSQHAPGTMVNAGMKVHPNNYPEIAYNEWKDLPAPQAAGTGNFSPVAAPSMGACADDTFVQMRSFPDQQKQADPQFDLYLLIGQSNMAGRGIITEDFAKEGNPQVFMLNRFNQWVPARHPLHFDKPSVAGVGPGLSFGIEMAKTSPAHRIGLIPCAVGGTSINVWKPGAYDSATHTHPYDDMLVRLQEALKQGVLKGIIWHQGESDSNPARAGGYLQKLEDLVALLRAVAGNDRVPFIAGEIGRYNINNANINDQLNKLPREIKYSGVASSEGLLPKEDHIHFTSASAAVLGQRFAEEMKKVQAEK